jgi:hypothetical protein
LLLILEPISEFFHGDVVALGDVVAQGDVMAHGMWWLSGLKGLYHEIFDPRFFSLNGTPGSPDSWANAVLNTDSNSRSNSNRFFLDNAKLKILFCCHGAGKITYDRFFFIECYFNGLCKGRTNFSTWV